MKVSGLFANNRADACCLCGSTQDLTGEHKVKASALKAEFGADRMVIGRSDDSSAARSAQGPKSKAFHFAARVCGVCNSTRTQPADLEFDRFNQTARQLLEDGRVPSDVFSDPRYIVGSEPYLNVFRYFAKLMCCHLADVGGPRPQPIANFAMGLTKANLIWLSVDEDWTYKRYSAVAGPQQYAAHGGLVIYAKKRTGQPSGFHSTLTFGRVRYTFYFLKLFVARRELRRKYPVFNDWCRAQGRLATATPLSQSELLMLGLVSDEAT